MTLYTIYFWYKEFRICLNLPVVPAGHALAGRPFAGMVSSNWFLPIIIGITVLIRYKICAYWDISNFLDIATVHNPNSYWDVDQQGVNLNRF